MEQKDWDDLQAQMASPWGSMRLQCDQYQITLEQQADGKTKTWYTAIFVDGYFKGVWMEADGDKPKFEEARRFLRKQSRPLYGAKFIRDMTKAIGKRAAAKYADKRHVTFSPIWKNFNSLKKHLIANNTSIQRIQ